jgi:hypothetical protein
MDDAMNTIYSAVLAPEEGTASTFEAFSAAGHVSGKSGETTDGDSHENLTMLHRSK